MKDIRIPVNVGGISFKNPFYVASGPTTKTVKQLVAIEDAGWAAASIKLSIDPAPYINRKPRYDLFEDRNALAFTTEKRLTFEEGLTLIREAKKVLNDLILFANITYSGDEGVAGWVNMAREFEAAGADIIELNMCCPNMSFNVDLTSAGKQLTKQQTGASLGQDENAVAEIVKEIKKNITIPLFVKLTPEGGKIARIAKALYSVGADAVSGTGNRMGIPLMDINQPEKAIYHLQEEVSMSCHSGSWLKPLAQRDTYEIRKLCGDDIKIAATGGITNWQDAVEMILCGGDLLGICSETLISGYKFLRPMLAGLHQYMQEHGYQSIEDFRGKIVPQLKSATEVTLYGGYARIIEPKLAGPCKTACPYHVPAQGYVQSVGRGEFKIAFDMIAEKGLLQGACAYVCPSPCEDACVRGAYGQPVRIRELKRYVLEKGRNQGWKIEEKTIEANGFSVAVVGAGAAGIEAASQLANAGYGVTLYEKEHYIGGMLHEYVKTGQLPAYVLEDIFESLITKGVKIKTDYALNRDFTITSLLDQTYDGIILAGNEGNALNLPGNMLGREHIQSTDIIRKDKKSVHEKSIVILGDGLYALQTAYIALQAGARKIFLVGRYNRKQNAVRKLLKEADRITLLEDATPVSLLDSTLQLKGTNEIVSTISSDAVFAVPTTLVTNDNPANVFAIRAGMAGGSNVIAAAAEGAGIAVKVDAYIRGDNASLKPVEGVVPARRKDVLFRTGMMPFDPVEKESLISNDEEAIAEGKRCLTCGCGEGCQLCKIICTDFAPHIVARDELYIEPKECVACGMCFNRCPNNNIEMVNTGEIV